MRDECVKFRTAITHTHTQLMSYTHTHTYIYIYILIHIYLMDIKIIHIAVSNIIHILHSCE